MRRRRSDDIDEKISLDESLLFFEDDMVAPTAILSAREAS
jgi:hypothetical protein